MDSRKYSVLVVSQSEKTVKALSGLLPSGEFSSVYTAYNAGKARRKINEVSIDFCNYQYTSSRRFRDTACY